MSHRFGNLFVNGFGNKSYLYYTYNFSISLKLFQNYIKNKNGHEGILCDHGTLVYLDCICIF